MISLLLITIILLNILFSTSTEFFALIIITATVLLVKNKNKFLIQLTGFAVITLSRLGEHFIFVIACITLLSEFKNKKYRPKLNEIPFHSIIVLIFLWILVEATFWSDWLIYLEKPNIPLLLSLKYSPPHLWFSLNNFFIWIILGLFCYSSIRSVDFQEKFFQGVTLGLIFAIPVITLQINDVAIPIIYEDSQFWRNLGRWSGTFIDPNAYGITATLIIPLVGSTFYLNCLKLIFSIIALFSGSRSYVVALTIYGIILVANYFSRILFLTFVIAVSIILLFLTFGPPIVGLSFVPVAIDRVLHTVNSQNFTEAFFSRYIFWYIAILIWASSPFVGIGFNQFREVMTTFAAKAGISLNFWVDNSNSLYLGVLAELGILGGVLLVYEILTFSGKRYVAKAKIARMVSYVFLLLLLFGPHIEFLSISIIIAVIIGVGWSFYRKDNYRFRCWKISFVVIVFIILLHGNYSQFGLYPWEPQPQGLARWTRTNSQFYLPCINSKATLNFIVPEGLINKDRSEQLKINFFIPDKNINYTSFYDIAPVKVQNLTIECGNKAKIANSEVKINLSLNRYWIPHNSGHIGDYRRLGVQLVSNIVW
jgi:hypothetical protein